MQILVSGIDVVRRLPKSVVVAVLVCGGLFLAETSWFRARHSVTFDETIYLSLSVRSVREGGLDPGFVNSGIAPLPMMLTYFPPLWLDPGADRSQTWQGEPDDPQRIVGPRIMNCVLIGLPLLAVVAAWLTLRQGPLAGAAGAALMALSPTIVAHGSIATTDLTFALFALLSLLVVAWMARAASVRRAAVAGAMIGTAIAAKYSGLFLLPVAGLMLLICGEARHGRREVFSHTARATGQFAALVLVAAIVCWGLHLFTTSGPLKMVPLEETAEYSPWLKVLGRGPIADWIMTIAHERLMRPAPVEGIFFQMRHNSEGHAAYLMGEQSQFGWWYYFPCAFLFKSTPVELILAGVILVSLLALLRSPRRSFQSMDVDRQTMLLGAAVLLVLLMTSRINIGQRYLLVLYPLVIMVGIDLVATACRAHPRRAAVLASLAIVLQAVGSFAVAPHYLAYFNQFAGGPEQGRWLLTDSNLDWGQDLPALRAFQSQHPEPMILWYFGTALPEAYGVQATNLEEFPDSLQPYTWAALSVSHLHGPYGPTGAGESPFATLRHVTPTAVCGHSIVVLDLRVPEVRDRLQTAIRQFQSIARVDPKHVPPRWKSAPFASD